MCGCLLSEPDSNSIKSKPAFAEVAQEEYDSVMPKSIKHVCSRDKCRADFFEGVLGDMVKCRRKPECLSVKLGLALVQTSFRTKKQIARAREIHEQSEKNYGKFKQEFEDSVKQKKTGTPTVVDGYTKRVQELQH